MPHFIHRRQIPFEVRHPHIERYVENLREALRSSILTDTQRDAIKHRLADIRGSKPSPLSNQEKES